MLGLIVTTLSMMSLIIANVVIYMENVRFADTRRAASDMSSIKGVIKEATELNRVASESKHYMRMYEVDVDYNTQAHICTVSRSYHLPSNHFTELCIDLAGSRTDRHIVFGGQHFKIDGVEKVYGKDRGADIQELVLSLTPMPRSWFVTILQIEPTTTRSGEPTIVFTF